MATDPQSLLSTAACYDCYLAQYNLLKLALLRQLVLNLNPMAATDPQSLLSQANCYSCYSAQWALLELALLSQAVTLLSSGGSGGALSPTCGNFGGGQPNFTPASGCANAVDTSNGRIWWFWSGAWH